MIGRPLGTRQEMDGPNQISHWSKSFDWSRILPTTIFSRPTLPDTYPEIAYAFPPSLLAPDTSLLPADINPKIWSTQTGFDGITSLPSIESGIEIAYEAPEDLRGRLESMVNGEAKYCIYELSSDKRRLTFKMCGEKGSNWVDYSGAFDDSYPGFALFRLKSDSILSLMNLRHDCQTTNESRQWVYDLSSCENKKNSQVLHSFKQGWEASLNEIFTNVISLDDINDDTSLNAVGAQYIYSKHPY